MNLIRTTAIVTSLFLFSLSTHAEGWILSSGIYKGVGKIKDQFSAVECAYDIKLTVAENTPTELFVIREMTYHDPINCDYQSTSHFVVKSMGQDIYRVSINNYEADHGFCSENFCMHHLSYSNGSKITEGIYKNGDKFTFSGMGTYTVGAVKVWSADIVKQ